jgi:hypothetical protein
MSIANRLSNVCITHTPVIIPRQIPPAVLQNKPDQLRLPPTGGTVTFRGALQAYRFARSKGDLAVLVDKDDETLFALQTVLRAVQVPDEAGSGEGPL